MGSTPELVWWKDSQKDKMTGIPATTAMMIRVGASRIQASRPWPSLSAFFLCLWPSPSVAGKLRGSAVAVAMRLPPLRNALSSRRSTWLRREPCGHQLLDQSLQLGLQCLQGRIGLSLTLECAIGGILDRQGDITVLHGLRTWLGGLDRLELRRHERELLHRLRVASTAPPAPATFEVARGVRLLLSFEDMNFKKSTAVPLFSAFLAIA